MISAPVKVSVYILIYSTERFGRRVVESSAGLCEDCEHMVIDDAGPDDAFFGLSGLTIYLSLLNYRPVRYNACLP